MVWLWALVAVAGTHDDELVGLLTRAHGLDAEQQAAVRQVLAGSERVGFGAQPISEHAAQPAQCEVARAGITPDPRHQAVCGRPHMVPLYDPARQGPDDAAVCIDAYEFPDVPCSYPVVWVRAREAAQLCEAVGKRLCDAHEWEGGCAGALGPADYPWQLATGDDGATQRAFRRAHNQRHADSWDPDAAELPAGTCATGSFKTPGCDGSDWRQCGSNTYPSGMFPDCRSPLGAYDLWGNAAEHMNLPLAPDQRASAGGLGVTEMKGSWFVWDTIEAHEDGCRWRAPYWHGGRVEAADSHRNYHLGFRCCADVATAPSEPAP